MTDIVLISDDRGLVAELKQAFAVHAPGIAVAALDDPGSETAVLAVCWYPPPGSLAKLPRLRLAHSVAAGIDHLLPALPGPGLPVCRVLDTGLQRGMMEYMRWAVIHYHRRLDKALRQQTRRKWLLPSQIPAAAFKVGVMGLGAMGGPVARDLADAGYLVRGWSGTGKDLPGVRSFEGMAALPEFLSGLDLLINLLPLTQHTTGILCAENFRMLAHGAVIVNGGRGQHLVIEDLKSALACGVIGAALLDVFDEEPLPAADSLWDLPGVTITPHMASSAPTESIVRQVVANFQRLSVGTPLINQVDRGRGY